MRPDERDERDERDEHIAQLEAENARLGTENAVLREQVQALQERVWEVAPSAWLQTWVAPDRVFRAGESMHHYVILGEYDAY